MDKKLANIPVVRSLIDLGEMNEIEELPIPKIGTTVTMAQQACWVSNDHFAVGRWDGSLSIFNKTDSSKAGQIITTAVSAPADQGIQMLGWIAMNTFISSNDASSMVVWHSPSGTFQDVVVRQMIRYDPAYGMANSSTVKSLGSILYLMTGHEHGFLLIWTSKLDGSDLTFVRAVDLTRSNPVNPWGLQQIRGVSWVSCNSQKSVQVATGSENGEICIVNVPSGTVLSRTIFNPSAERGINAISVTGKNLLVANCSVGSSDKNLWYYEIAENDWSVILRDSKNLIVDTTLLQAFNFDVVWGAYSGGLCFFSATQEGELWMGTIAADNRISILGNENVAVADLGAALAAGPNSVVYAAYNVTGFKTSEGDIEVHGDPNRVDCLMDRN